MPSKQTLESVLKKHLPKESASALMREINKLVKGKATPATIQKTISQYVTAQVKKECFIHIPVFNKPKHKPPGK